MIDMVKRVWLKQNGHPSLQYTIRALIEYIYHGKSMLVLAKKVVFYVQRLVGI